jgi:2-succinyl-6-hydroxy-2,4-cyclohexadiene-1-carboxylate synthase
MIVNGVNYHVRVEGEGAPLLALHGFTGSSANWSLDLFPPGVRLIAPDQIGHGQTDSPDAPERYEIDFAARDAADLAKHYTLRSLTLFGYSMGGRLALYAALHRPHAVAKLILESASPGIADDAERAARRHNDTALADRIEREGVPAFVEYWENLPLFATQTPAQRAQLRPIRLAQNPRGLANSLRGMGTGAQPSLWERLGALRMPVLLIAGELDPKYSAIARQMSERIANCTLAIIPGAGHTVHLEQPDAYAAALREFLAS